MPENQSASGVGLSDEWPQGLFYSGAGCEHWHPAVDIPYIEQPVQREVRFLGRIRGSHDLEHIEDIRVGDVFIYKDILYIVENVTFDIEAMKTRIHAIGVGEDGKEKGIIVYVGGGYLEYDSIAEKDIEERTVGHYPSDMGNEEEDLEPPPELDEFLSEFSIIGDTYEI